jgi:hypothetical protein
LQRGLEMGAVGQIDDLVAGIEPVAEHQKSDHRAQQASALPKRPLRGRRVRHLHGRGRAGLLVLAEDQGHDQADHDPENNRADHTRHAELESQHPRGQKQGQHVDGRAGVKERRSRPQTRPHPIDPRKHRQHAARTNRQHRARNRGHRIGLHLVRLGAEVFQHRFLREEGGNRAGDEQGWDHAGQRVVPRVPLKQLEGFDNGVGDPGVGQRQKVSPQEDGDERGEYPPFLLVHC